MFHPIFLLDIYDDRSYNNFMKKRMLKKQQIMKMSIGVMFKQGYHGTGIKDLTDAAGIPKGSLYNYFINKEDYAKEALKYYYEVMSETFMAKLSDDTLSAKERIIIFYSSAIDNIKLNQNNYDGCFLGKMGQEMGAYNDNIQQVINDIHQDIISKIKINIEEAIKVRSINTAIDPEVLADVINSSWQGALQSIKIRRDFEPLNNFFTILKSVLLR